MLRCPFRPPHQSRLRHTAQSRPSRSPVPSPGLSRPCPPMLIPHAPWSRFPGAPLPCPPGALLAPPPRSPNPSPPSFPGPSPALRADWRRRSVGAARHRRALLSHSTCPGSLRLSTQRRPCSSASAVPAAGERGVCSWNAIALMSDVLSERCTAV